MIFGFDLGGGEDSPLFGVNGYVPLNRVWFSRSCVLNRVYFNISRLEQGVFAGLEALNPHAGTSNCFKSNSMKSFIKKNFLYGKLINKKDKKRRTQAQ